MKDTFSVVLISFPAMKSITEERISPLPRITVVNPKQLLNAQSLIALTAGGVAVKLPESRQSETSLGKGVNGRRI